MPRRELVGALEGAAVGALDVFADEDEVGVVLEAVLDPSQFTDGAFRYREDADAGPA
jgi:hypothetical protein